VDNEFDAIIDVMRHLAAKDVFQKYYKNSLARRLIFKRSASHDDEVAFIARLRLELGASYTSRLDGSVFFSFFFGFIYCCFCLLFLLLLLLYYTSRLDGSFFFFHFFWFIYYYYCCCFCCYIIRLA